MISPPLGTRDSTSCPAHPMATRLASGTPDHGDGDGQDISLHLPAPPGGGSPMVPVTDYGVSFGDNYCIGALNMNTFFPTETPYTTWPPVPGQPRIGWPGYQGTYADINGNLPPTGAPGALRGMFDVNNGQSVKTRHHRRHQ